MEKDQIVEVIENLEDKSNKDLFDVADLLYNEFENTKELIISLTRHMDTVEEMYNKVNSEIEKRSKS
jgi:hypothetical protein